MLDTKLGFMVKYLRKSQVDIKVRSSYHGSVCGMCGNYDGDINNDMVIGNHCPSKYTPGEPVSSLNKS